jgi:hypothetical protein
MSFAHLPQTALDETEDGASWLVTCPHCYGGVLVAKDQVNCTIFRHARYKHNGEQVNPHLPKHECDTLVANRAVDGCCRPFRVFVNQRVAVVCDYI